MKWVSAVAIVALVWTGAGPRSVPLEHLTRVDPEPREAQANGIADDPFDPKPCRGHHLHSRR
jgi:hypothetical protein